MLRHCAFRPFGCRLILPSGGVRGCTGCPYLYEEIDADHRVIITSKDDMQSAIDEIRAIASQSAG